jgi:beta-N-acetylhexosaminidase
VATVSKKVLTGLLRDELGFEGVITTDSMTMGGIAIRYGVANACALSLEAGADLVLMKAENRLIGETFEAIRKFVEENRITEEELNNKLYRVLSLKYEYGLFTNGILMDEDPEDVIKDEKIINLSKLVARRSVLVAGDRDQVLPVSKEEKVLVIEQINKTPNNIHWHPGILYSSCLEYNKNLTYLETRYTFDGEDKENIKRMATEFDTIIVTNFYIRGSLSNNETIQELLLQDKSKKVIVVSNTPYSLSIPEGADNVIVTFATTPENIKVVAGTIFGEIIPEGEWPVENGVKF